MMVIVIGWLEGKQMFYVNEGKIIIFVRGLYIEGRYSRVLVQFLFSTFIIQEEV